MNKTARTSVQQLVFTLERGYVCEGVSEDDGVIVGNFNGEDVGDEV